MRHMKIGLVVAFLVCFGGCSLARAADLDKERANLVSQKAQLELLVQKTNNQLQQVIGAIQMLDYVEKLKAEADVQEIVTQYKKDVAELAELAEEVLEEPDTEEVLGEEEKQEETDE